MKRCGELMAKHALYVGLQELESKMVTAET